MEVFTAHYWLGSRCSLQAKVEWSSPTLKERWENEGIALKKKKKKNMLLFQRGKPFSPVSLSFLCSVAIYLTLVSQTIASTIRATGMRSWLYHVEHIFCLILNYLWRTLYLITKTDSPAVVLANSSQMACQQVSLLAVVNRKLEGLNGRLLSSTAHTAWCHKISFS